MRNISHFLNFKGTNTPVMQWITAITKILSANPIFCNMSSKNNFTEKRVSLVLEDSTEDFSRQEGNNSFLPDHLQETLPSRLSYPIFSINEVLESERTLTELLDTEIVLINCSSITENGLLLDSITSRLINKAKCPIILLPDNVSSPKNIEHLVYTTDIRFTELRFMRSFAKFCESIQSELTIAHVSESGIPDLDIQYGKLLFNDCFEGKIKNCPMQMENIKRLDIQKYPDLVHEYLLGDIYGMINKNQKLTDGDYLNSSAIKLAGLAKKPVMLINNF